MNGGFVFCLRLPEDSRLSLKLFDLRGRLVQTVFDGMQQAGSFTVAIPRGLAPGAYILSGMAGERRIGETVLVER